MIWPRASPNLTPIEKNFMLVAGSMRIIKAFGMLFKQRVKMKTPNTLKVLNSLDKCVIVVIEKHRGHIGM